jgi:beta-glucosidase
MMDFLPSRKSNLVEHFLAKSFHYYYNQSWIRATLGKKEKFGVVGVISDGPVVKECLGKRICDFIGINYYTKCYIRWGVKPWDPEGLWMSGDYPRLHVAFAKENEVRSDLTWAIHPEGFRKIVKEVAKYKLPIYITENGIADSNDSRRIAFLRSHLQVVDHLKRQDIPIEGYFHWSLIDNFEWIKGIGPRFGLVEIDYENFSRKPRGSYYEYQKIIASKVLE